MDKAQELKSLKRGLKAMVLINTLGSITIAELARQMGLARTTAERVLITLWAEGYVDRDTDTKAFFLTAQVHALSDGYAEESQLVAIARPLMVDLTREIGWPLCLAMPMGEYMSVRVTTDPETTLNLHRRHIGTSAPMGLVSSGIAFLAHLDDAQRSVMLDMLERSDDPGQSVVKDKARLDYLLQKSREDGYSFGLDYGRERSVAVPIISGGRVRGAMLMAFMARALSNEMVEQKFVPRLKALVAAIEERTQAPVRELPQT